MNYKDLFDLKGKVAIVTGASKGIGASMARALAEFGARVVVSSRKQEAVDEVAEQLSAQGMDALAVACNVGDETQLENLMAKTTAQFGGVDILINNAATNPTYGPLLNAGTDVFEKIMNVNLRAGFRLANLCHPIMKSRGGGSIINIASVEGLKPSAGLGLYSVSKAALIMLTKTQAKEWGRDQIRANVICPGLIKTKFSAALWSNEKVLDSVTKNLPSARIGSADEMAGLALYLSSNASSYCTGSVFTADGGWMIAG